MPKVILVTTLLLAMLVGGGLVALVAAPPLIEPAVAFLRSATGVVLLCSVAGVFILGPLALFMRWVRVLVRSREISYTTENGRIAVNLIAIEEALTRAIEGEPEVKKAHVRVYEDRVKRAVIIDAVMTLWEVPNVTERNRFCQRLLRRRFAELMPEQNAVEVNLSVHRLNVRRPETSPPAAAGGTAMPPVAQQPAPLRAASEVGGDSGGRLPIDPGEMDLYVGPHWPVDGEDDDASVYQNKPTTVRMAKPGKKT